MFKKKCSKCNKKIEKSNRFCPSCGKDLNPNSKEDYGFLGKDDVDDSFNLMSNTDNLPINKILKTAMKMSEKMIRDMQKQSNQPNQSNPSNFPYSNMRIKFMVNGKEVPLNNNQRQQIKKPDKIKPKKISDEKAKQFAKLPRKEPKTKMKRISNRLLYELSVPGVKDIEDVLINQLENSIEIKALSKNKVYSKILEINLPIVGYKLDKDNLILELQAK